MQRTLFVFWMFLCVFFLGFSQENTVWLQPNRGQWDSRILYKIGLTKGNFFIEENRFTFALNDLNEVYHAAHHGEEVDKIHFQTIHSTFLNSSWKGKVIESDSSSHYNNYFLGKDSKKWHSKVYSYQQIAMKDFYPGIDLIVKTTPSTIKYLFYVHPNVSPHIIKTFYEGMDKLTVLPQELLIHTRFGPIKEYGLKAWTIDENGRNNSVSVEYQLAGDTVSYQFPEGYDTSKPLVIDPYLSFSTFTGATDDNWGFTAAPDKDENLLAGGIVFGPGYPITTGAFDASFNGGDGPVLTSFHIDMGISKFSEDGSQLLYSTFVGGNGNETPNSIITDEQGNLYIMGISTSTDFPVTANAYQHNFSGGVPTTQIAINFDGTDIVVAKLSADGSTMMACTYVGGTKNDGLNISSLNYNYGDVFRGEIILDNNGDVVFTSSTKSTDFPIVNGAKPTMSGGQDAVVVKMDPLLSTIIWSTYLGGNGDDSGFSIQASSTNNLYVTGGTNSSDLSFTGHIPSFQGGSADGYVIELDGNTSAIINGTHIGTPNYDQSFFVQIDVNDRVYVYGQSLGDIPISSGVYANPNSGQFIQKYTADLSTLEWSTVVGGGNGVIEISPTAFLVSDCGQIFYTGWGGEVNRNNSQATSSTTTGFPITPTAFQTNTNGNNFYIGVLSKDAVSLDYATFMGGTSSSHNHVDGGTSRFDKNGTIYHAVCGACGGNLNGFTTTPGAYSQTNNSPNCNLAAWKFNLGAINAAISIPDFTICLPDSADFINQSNNGDIYTWHFGDGSTSTSFEPSHYYSTPGVYDVMLVVEDSEGCFESDTAYIQVNIAEFNGSVVDPLAPICPGESFQLEASGGTSYQWSPASVLDDPTSATPIATVDSTTTFTVVVSAQCGIDTLQFTLEVENSLSSSSDDMTICRGDTVQIWASGGDTYSWISSDMNAIVGSSTSDTIYVAPDDDMTFTATVTSAGGCEMTENITITVYQTIPHPILDDTAHICKGEVVYVSADGAPSIQWHPNEFIDTTSGSDVVISSTEDKWYYADFTNPCGTVRDSIFIDFSEVFPNAGNDTTVCPGDAIYLHAEGGIMYYWTPNEYVASPKDSFTVAFPPSPTVYSVVVMNEFGCSETETVHVSHFPLPTVTVSPDYYGLKGDEVELSAQGTPPNGVFSWSPTEFLSCVNCPNPIATPPNSMDYIVTYEDINGCEAKASVSIYFEPLLYVPNTFTPNDDRFNKVFYVEGGNITDFNLKIFNRWGELIYESDDINEGWNGTYDGLNCPDGTYVWKLKYADMLGEYYQLVGHVNLLR